MRMPAVRRLFVAVLLTCAPVFLGQMALGAEPGIQIPEEPAPTLRASDLLVADVLRGPNYELEEFVQVEQHRYLFKIRTEWGTIPAHGISMLELKLREIYAIDAAQKLANDTQFVQGVFTSAKKTPQGVRLLLTEPDGGLLRAPPGEGRLVRWKVDPANRRAGNESRRRLAVAIGADPETSQPVLKGMLDGLLLRKGAGALPVKTVPFPVISGLALLSLTPEAKELLITKSPEELNAQLALDLDELGIPERIVSQFCFEVNYTTKERLLFLHNLRPLKHVQNLHVLVYSAIHARNETDGLSAIRELRLLNEVHQQDPIREVLNVGWSLAMTQSGKLVVVSAADYIVHNREVADAIAVHRRDFPHAPSKLYTSGRVSALARKAFAAAQIEVIER